MINFKVDTPLMMQFSKTAEEEVIERFGSVEDFNVHFTDNAWNLCPEDVEVKLSHGNM